MKKAVFVVLALLLSVAQCTVTWRFGLGWHNYGVALCTVVAISVFDMKLGLVSGGVCGFFIDCIQGRFTGLNLLILLIAAFLVSFLSKQMNGKSLLAVIVLTFLVTFVTEFLQYWIYIAVNGSGNISFALTKLIFPQAFINTVCAIPVYLLVKLLRKKLKMQKERWEY